MLQPFYRFVVPNCHPGTLVGKVVATDQRKAAVYYLIETPNSDIAVNQKTGQLLLINYIRPGIGYLVVVRAASTSGKRTDPLLSTTTIALSLPYRPIAHC